MVVLVQTPGKPETLQAVVGQRAARKPGWACFFSLNSHWLSLADILGRVVSLIDSLLSERVTNSSSIRLMEHAATLDLEDFENAEFQDQLDRCPPPDQRADDADGANAAARRRTW